MAGTAAQRYAVLEPKRFDYLERARKCSELTLPHLFPASGASSATQFKTPYQGLGARGVNNLASKLLLSLLPPNAPFFKMTLAENELDELKNMGAQANDLRTEIDTALSKVEKRFMSWVEAVAIRPSASEFLKQLIVGGNVLLQLDEKVGFIVHRLDRYVVRRDPSGRVLELAIKEPVDYTTLPAEIQGLVEQKPVSTAPGVDTERHLYTYVIFKDGKYSIHQEIDGKIVPGSEGSYVPEELPFLVLRFTKVSGEDYGRSYAEEYFGDLKSLEALSKAVVLSSAIVSKAVVMVRPGGVTNQRKLAEAETGDVIAGDLNDVGMLQFDKWADLRVAFEAIKDITQRLAFAFLLNTAIQRPGERVTAEEIRFMARELDDALGGTYAIFSQDFQVPFLRAGLALLTTTSNKDWKLPKLPNGVKPVIVTGLEALGRGNDLQKLDAFIGGAAQMLGPEAVLRSLNASVYMKRRALALGVDTEGLIRSEEEIAAEQEQAQMMQMMQQVGPNAVNQLGQMAQKQMETDPNGESAN